MSEESAKKSLVAEDIMTKDVISVKEDLSVTDVGRLVLDKRISGVPVLGEDDRIVGIVTITDLFEVLGNLLFEHTFGRYFKDKVITVSQIMSREVETVAPDTSVRDILKISVYKGIHSIPVVKDGYVVGIVGKRDILNAGLDLVHG